VWGLPGHPGLSLPPLSRNTLPDGCPPPVAWNPKSPLAGRVPIAKRALDPVTLCLPFPLSVFLSCGRPANLLRDCARVDRLFCAVADFPRRFFSSRPSFFSPRPQRPSSFLSDLLSSGRPSLRVHRHSRLFPLAFLFAAFAASQFCRRLGRAFWFCQVHGGAR